MRKFILLGLLVIAAVVALWSLNARRKEEAWNRAYVAATNLYWNGKPIAAEKALEHLLPETEKRWPNDRHLGLTLNLLGLTKHRLNKNAEAEQLFLRALQILSHDPGAERTDLAKAEANLGELYLDTGHTVEAEAKLVGALSIYKASPGLAQGELGSALVNLGRLRMIQGRYVEAGSLFEQAVLVDAHYLSSDNPDRIGATLSLANSYRLQSRFAEAKPLYEESLSFYASHNAHQPLNIPGLKSFLNYALLLVDQGNMADATRIAGQVAAAAQRIPDSQPDDRARILILLAELRERTGEARSAQDLARQAQETLAKSQNPDSALLAAAQSVQGRALLDLGKYPDADTVLEKALHSRESSLGANHPQVAAVVLSLAELRLAQHRYPEARNLAQRALPVLEKAEGDESLDVARSLECLASADQALKTFSSAETSLKRAVAIRHKCQFPSHPAYAKSLQTIAALYIAEAKPADAAAVNKRLREIRSGK